MVVVLIIGILIAIAIPVFSSVRANAQRKACFSSERTVESAYYTYGANQASSSASFATWNDLMNALVPSELAARPKCPAVGATYSWDPVNKVVQCTSHGSFHDGP